MSTDLNLLWYPWVTTRCCLATSGCLATEPAQRGRFPWQRFLRQCSFASSPGPQHALRKCSGCEGSSSFVPSRWQPSFRFPDNGFHGAARSRWCPCSTHRFRPLLYASFLVVAMDLARCWATDSGPRSTSSLPCSVPLVLLPLETP